MLASAQLHLFPEQRELQSIMYDFPEFWWFLRCGKRLEIDFIELDVRKEG